MWRGTPVRPALAMTRQMSKAGQTRERHPLIGIHCRRGGELILSTMPALAEL